MEEYAIWVVNGENAFKCRDKGERGLSGDEELKGGMRLDLWKKYNVVKVVRRQNM